MGFGLNVVPMILSKRLLLDKRLAAGTDRYTAEILVNNSLVPVK